MPQIDRFVLGTAQLGMPYGIANTSGQPDQSTADDILQTAWEKGIRILDTAQAYGESENVIGRFMRAHPNCPFEVITKLAPGVDIASAGAIESAVAASRERLGHSVGGLMLHRFDQLKAWNGVLGKTLSDLKSNGDIVCLGVSVYGPDEFRHALELPDIELIQAPFNVFDRRLLDENLLQKAHDRGRRIFLRSALLQGLLAMEPKNLPAGMAFAIEPLERWQGFCRDHAYSSIFAALQFVRLAAPDAKVVIGCETSWQLRDNVSQWSAPEPGGNFLGEVPVLSSPANILIDPSNWPPFKNL